MEAIAVRDSLGNISQAKVFELQHDETICGTLLSSNYWDRRYQISEPFTLVKVELPENDYSLH